MIQASDIEKARSRLVEIVAATVALKQAGREFQGLCCFHQERSPSFYLCPDKGFYHCFGCGAHGDAIGFLMQLRNMTFIQACSELLGLPPQRAKEAAPSTDSRPEPPRDTGAEVAQILAGCGPITETTAAWLYLKMRGPYRARMRTEMGELLAHPALFCTETKTRMPGMVAPVRNRDGVITAIQRFYLKASIAFDGSGIGPKDNRADVKMRKKSLGHFGDGAVRLSPVLGFRLGVCEGVETAIAAKELYKIPVWASCGVSRLGSLWIPPDVTEIVIFADSGGAGEQGAAKAADGYRGQGIHVEVIAAPEGHSDFDEALMEQVR